MFNSLFKLAAFTLMAGPPFLGTVWKHLHDKPSVSTNAMNVLQSYFGADEIDFRFF